MGLYNPYAPQVLGQEWAPIRNENLSFIPDPFVVPTEYGHTFVLTSSQRVRDIRIYADDFPIPPINPLNTVQIYPVGGEALSGPIQRIIIPVEQVFVTGAVQSPGGITGAEVLFSPADSSYYFFDSDNPTVQRVMMSFNTSDYTALTGKRILQVNILYASLGTAVWGSLGPNDGIVTIPTGIDISNVGSSITPPLYLNAPVQRRRLGDAAPFVTLTSGEAVPWAYSDLSRLDAGSSNRMFYEIAWGNLAGTLDGHAMYLYYVGLEIIFCEERRLITGMFADSNVKYGANIVPLRDITTRAADPVLAAGAYTMTVSRASDANYNACRELYALPTHQGVQIDLRYPQEDHLDETFIKTETRILPQLTIHTSGGPLTEAHVYGRQARAQVYGSITATQDILDSAANGAATWPWVRFYARRFGETTVPLLLDCATIAGSTVEITPEDFDALDEIIDGWKEITLRFDTPPTMGAGTTPQWRWSATGEVSGNRWEILGATAPAVSGVAGNLFNLVPSPNQLSSATYGRPSSGAAVNFGWIPQYAPPVTATADDQTSDAVILFAQDMRTITGLAAATATQELTGVGLNCDIAPCCVPTALLYHRITWPLPYGTGVADDTFTRTEAAGSWGSADSGQAYTLNGTAADFSVDGSSGLIVPSATGSNREAWLNVGGPDQDVTVSLEISDAAETGQLWGGVIARVTDASNYYRATMRYTSTSTVELQLDKRVAGAETTLATVTLPLLSPSALTPRTIRIQVAGTFIRAKLWDTDTAEPWWQLYTTDSSLTTGNNAGVFARDDTTVASTTFTFDNLAVGPPDFGFGFYELQRSDTVETDWATIMKATAVATTGFSDYEARVDTVSSYRIRAVDVYGFEGPWSDEVDLFLPTPGASGGCIEQGHVLLFTSNERQDGSINLAYASAWEANQTVDEDFQFPEANFVQMQGMYNRDYFVAFRPLERGGERFQRTLLVQAAAISPPTLGDFRGLRDMAWDTVSYICVRDEDANRWLATVIVPSGRVLRDRRLYLAPVDIIEVTATPSPVDP